MKEKRKRRKKKKTLSHLIFYLLYHSLSKRLLYSHYPVIINKHASKQVFIKTDIKVSYMCNLICE